MTPWFLSWVGCPFSTEPAFGGFAHEDISPGQNLWCTALLNPLCTIQATQSFKVFWRWIERSDVRCHWRNVVRAWIKSWMALAWGLCQQQSCVVRTWKKHLYIWGFLLCFLLCHVSFSKMRASFPVWLYFPVFIAWASCLEGILNHFLKLSERQEACYSEVTRKTQSRQEEQGHNEDRRVRKGKIKLKWPVYKLVLNERTREVW